MGVKRDLISLPDHLQNCGVCADGYPKINVFPKTTLNGVLIGPNPSEVSSLVTSEAFLLSFSVGAVMAYYINNVVGHGAVVRPSVP